MNIGNMWVKSLRYTITIMNLMKVHRAGFPKIDLGMEIWNYEITMEAINEPRY